MLIAFQQNISDKDDFAVLIDKNNKALFEDQANLIPHEDKLLVDLFKKHNEKDLYCYRCLGYTTPIYIARESEYYIDCNHNPIYSLLPHCHRCEQEVYSKTIGDSYKGTSTRMGPHRLGNLIHEV